jgi:chromate transporter
VLLIGKRTLIDVPTALIAVTTAALLFKYKKLQEPFIILAAAAVGVVIKLILH